MLDILILFVIGGWFARDANVIHKSGILWAVLGILTFYIPVMIFRGVIGLNPIIAIILSLVCVLGLKLILKRKVQKYDKAIDEKWKEEQKKLVEIGNNIDLNSLIGQVAYDHETKKYVGKIINVDRDEQNCTVMSSFGKEIKMKLNEILVKGDML